VSPARLALLLSALAAPVRAAGAAEANPGTTTHRGQWSLRAGFVQGYEFHHRYERSPFCRYSDFFPTRTTDPNAPPYFPPDDCWVAPPPELELAIAYALTAGFEPYVFTRLGLWSEEATFTGAGKMLGAGARIYAVSEPQLKLFIEPAFGVAFEDHTLDPRFFSTFPPALLTPDSYKTDLVFHLGVGPQYDLTRHFGVFANAGVDVGVIRALTVLVSVHYGVQARFP
jgi:hypothetical protein